MFWFRTGVADKLLAFVQSLLTEVRTYCYIGVGQSHSTLYPIHLLARSHNCSIWALTGLIKPTTPQQGKAERSEDEFRLQGETGKTKIDEKSMERFQAYRRKSEKNERAKRTFRGKTGWGSEKGDGGEVFSILRFFVGLLFTIISYEHPLVTFFFHMDTLAILSKVARQRV